MEFMMGKADEVTEELVDTLLETSKHKEKRD